MKTKKPPAFVPTECLQKGFFLNGAIYPIIKMQWVDGTTLDQYLSNNYEKSETILDLAEQFRDIVRYLEKERIAHGDLQHGNIIVENGKIKIIDYDGIYLPEIDALGADDIGHHNYQHPQRDEKHYHHLLDRFSAIVIYLGLLAIAKDPRFFRNYNNRENIIFKESDFKKPRESQLFKELLNEDSIAFLCENFLTICEGKMEDIPSLDEFILFNPFESESPIQNSQKKPISQGVMGGDPQKGRNKTKKEFDIPHQKRTVTLTQERERKKYDQKIAYSLEILEDNPKNIKHLMQLAECYYNIGDFSKSLEKYNKIKTIDPKFPRIDYWIDMVLERQRSEKK